MITEVFEVLSTRLPTYSSCGYVLSQNQDFLQVQKHVRLFSKCALLQQFYPDFLCPKLRCRMSKTQVIRRGLILKNASLRAILGPNIHFPASKWGYGWPLITVKNFHRQKFLFHITLVCASVIT